MSAAKYEQKGEQHAETEKYYSKFVHRKLAETIQGSVMLTLQRGLEREKEIAQSSACFARNKSFDDMIKEIPFSMSICNAERS